MDIFKPTPNLDTILEEFQRLQQAYELLKKVYIEGGPYSQRPITSATSQEINNFFGFDDSE